jgi:predicted nucleic acid-binding protein
MSGNNLLLDTNIVLYLLGGDSTLVSLLDDKKLYLSFISELELLSYKGISQNELSVIKRFVKECIVVDITPDIKELCIDLRKRNQLKLPDAIIAATASFLNIPFVSADKIFTKVKGIDIIFYEK